MNSRGFNSIFVKLLLAFMIVNIPLYALSIIVTYRGGEQMSDRVIQANESKLAFHSQHLEFELTRMSMLLNKYLYDQQLLNLATAYPILSNYERDSALNETYRKLGQIAQASPYIKNVTIYLTAMQTQVSTNKVVEPLDRPNLDGLVRSGNNLNGPLSIYDGRLFLLKSYPFYIDKTMTPEYVLAIELSLSELERMLNGITEPGQGGSFLLFAEGAFLLADSRTPAEFARRYADDLRMEGPKEQAGASSLADGLDVHYFSQRQSQFAYRLVSYVPDTVLKEPVRQYTNGLWAIAAISCAIVVVFAAWVYRSIHNPLKRILRGFKKLEQGDMSSFVRLGRNDELGHLILRFNGMVEKLKVLIEDNYVQRLHANEAQLKQLQSQVTPHFLYNSLFTIKQMAEMNDNEAVMEFADYLGHYFQYMTRNAEQEVSLDQEFEHARIYWTIQGIRFARRLSIDCEPLPSCCRSIRVPRIILQPIIENAFEHGLKNKSKGGVLRIRHAASTGRFTIAVEDNGSGLTDEELDALQKRLEPKPIARQEETTGMFNVHERLKIMFGEEYGLQLSRSRLGGLLVRIRVPMKGESP